MQQSMFIFSYSKKRKKEKKTDKACFWHSALTRGSDERFATGTKTRPSSQVPLHSAASTAATQIPVTELYASK